MTTAVATGRITPQRLEQSVRRVLEIKRRLGLFQSRTVPLDSIMLVVGARRFQDQADDVAVRALTLVRDVGGRLHALRAHRSRMALIAYADENNGGVGQTMTQLLRPLGSPYLLNQAPGAKAYLVAWSGVRASERAVALALLGRVPITGHLPIRIPPAYPLGWGVVIPDAQP